MRRKLIVATTFLGGLFFFLVFMLPKGLGGESLSKLESPALQIVQIIGAMAVGLGVVNIIRVHGAKIAKRDPKMAHSIALIVAMLVMVVVTLWNHQRRRVMKPLKRSAGLAAYHVEKLAEASSYHLLAETGSLPEGIRSKAGVFKVEEKDGAKGFLIFCSAEAAGTLPGELDTPVEITKPSEEQVERRRSLSLEAIRSIEKVLASTRAALRLLVPPVSALDGLDEKLSSVNQALDADAPAVLFKAADGAARLRDKIVEDSGAVTAALKKTHLSRFEEEMLFKGLFSALGSAMFSLLAFYIAAAAYRAFRVQTGETALLMASAVLVMLGQVPLGLYVWDQLPALRGWVLSKVNVGGFRAISIGAGVAWFAMAVRMWLSLDRQTMSGESQ